MRATTAPAGGFPLGLATAAAMGRNLPLPANRSIRLPVARKAQSGGPRYRSSSIRVADTKVTQLPEVLPALSGSRHILRSLPISDQDPLLRTDAHRKRRRVSLPR
jgi:hypothetical protein